MMETMKDVLDSVGERVDKKARFAAFEEWWSAMPEFPGDWGPGGPVCRRRFSEAMTVLRMTRDLAVLDLDILKSMHPATRLPRFACMSLESYRQGAGAGPHDFRPDTVASARLDTRMNLEGNRHLLTHGYDPRDVKRPEDKVYIAKPPSPVPARLYEKVQGLPGSMHVLWEAVWEEAPVVEAKDPILFTVVDRVAFVVGEWDMTKAEAYVRREFTL